MGKQHFARKRRGFKGPNTPKVSEMSKRIRKNFPTKDDIVHSSSPSISASEEVEAEEDLEEVVVHKSSMYDSLLKTLGSGRESLANVYKRRQREEEGKSDTDEDVDNVSESFSMSEQEDDGSDIEPPRSPVVGSSLQGSALVGVEHNEDAGTDDDFDDDGASDTDEEHDSKVKVQSVADALLTNSSFNDHLEYKLSKADVDDITKRKWKYKWEVPAVDMSNCKWMGTGESFLKDTDINSGYGLKPRLYKHWLDMYNTSGGSNFHSSRHRFFFSLFNSYRDILHHNKKPFYLKGLEEDSSIMDSYIMHSLNHIYRTRDLVMKNDAKVGKHPDGAKEVILHTDTYLDRGFTRPKVLILLPLASIALRVVKRLIQLIPPKHKVHVEHIDRFSNDFGTGGVEDMDGLDDIENSKSQQSSKPADFQKLFGGNNNDHFMVGIKFTKRSIKLYSDFYSSDMIVASPLGLVTKVGEAEVEKEKDVDYLSSIELLIIDHADVIAMQNWSHVSAVVDQLNRIPSNQHGTDIMRIREWYLDEQARFYRQTIILGSHLNPDINALFNHHCLNYQGKVKLGCVYKGVLPKVLLPVRQVFERFDVESIVDADDARFEYFTKKVFPKIKDSIQGGFLIFISSYFEFVRVRNFLKSQDASFCLLGEYTKQSDISRGRVWFFQGRRKIMLYTERAHFYHRYKIRGIQNLIIYSLPERKEFYPEIVNMLEGSHSMTSTALFSRFDQFRLDRIVGTGSAKRMISSEKRVFVFC